MAHTDAETGRSAFMFARLAELPNYVWDHELEPFHSVSRLEAHANRKADRMHSPTTTGTSLVTERPLATDLYVKPVARDSGGLTYLGELYGASTT